MSAETNTVKEHSPDKNFFGFWVYLMTDCILFASLFATFAVLRNNTYGGPAGLEIFDLSFVLAETLILLTSSFTCGLGIMSAYQFAKQRTLLLFGVTFALGLTFLGLEIWEFRELVQEGHGWKQSAFLSSFFTLVGTHGLHILIGLIWMSVLIINVAKVGLNSFNVQKLRLLSYFWHFLDIIWIFIFTIVYLLGVIG